MQNHFIDKWQDFRNLVSGENFQSWAFRGQSNASWPMFSSLSRHLLNFGIDKRAWSHQEERIIRIFQRKAHLYLTHIPDKSDTFEWLSIMQHHGAPTRLLDFTFSPYVAAYFALQRATAESVVWAVFPPKIDSNESIALNSGEVIIPRKMWMRDAGNFCKYYLPGKIPFVMQGEPHSMNKRQIAQSGTFLVPGCLGTVYRMNLVFKTAEAKKINPWKLRASLSNLVAILRKYLSLFIALSTTFLPLYLSRS